jgi:hypothetical protein
MEMMVPCDLRASSRTLGKEFSSNSGLILESTTTKTKYLITTGLLAFEGVDRFMVFVGERQNERIDLEPAKSGAAFELRSRNALALELPSNLKVYSGFKDYIEGHRIEIGAECQTHPGIGGRIVGVGAVIKVPHATTDACTIMTGLLRIRFNRREHRDMAGAVWHVDDFALAMTLAQSDEFAFAVPVSELLTDPEQQLRVYKSDFTSATHASASSPGRNDNTEDAWHRFQLELVE